MGVSCAGMGVDDPCGSFQLRIFRDSVIHYLTVLSVTEKNWENYFCQQLKRSCRSNSDKDKGLEQV